MAFTLKQVVPWGRSFKEYVRMFDLTKKDLQKRIIGCGDGPASFNAEMKSRGYKVVLVTRFINLPLNRLNFKSIKRML